jgi:Integral membrane protein possibly involved in chromosome condensation
MKKYILIGLFGIGGAICRYCIGLIFHETFPWGTLIVNIVGCLLLPFLFVFIKETGIFSREIVTALGTGFIGAFTTFSSFTIDIIKLYDSGKSVMAILYLVTSLAGGMIAATISFSISNYLADKWLKKEV